MFANRGVVKNGSPESKMAMTVSDEAFVNSHTSVAFRPFGPETGHHRSCQMEDSSDITLDAPTVMSRGNSLVCWDISKMCTVVWVVLAKVALSHSVILVGWMLHPATLISTFLS
jgi:hypothetical protein